MGTLAVVDLISTKLNLACHVLIRHRLNIDPAQRKSTSYYLKFLRETLRGGSMNEVGLYQQVLLRLLLVSKVRRSREQTAP